MRLRSHFAVSKGACFAEVSGLFFVQGFDLDLSLVELGSQVEI